MSFQWKKLGRIFDPTEKLGWLQSHAWVPTPDPIGEGYIRVYFAGRNTENFSQIGAFTIHLDRPSQILDLSTKPILSLGDLGLFDDSAVIPSCMLNLNGKKYLYYVGWMAGNRVPYHAMVGMASSDNNGITFQKNSRAPLLPRNEIDPFFIATPFVRVEGIVWRMWYTTNTEWDEKTIPATPKYHIKYAESQNGIDWDRKGVVAIDFQDKTEYSISRPWVIKKDGQYYMWYAYRGQNYRIGYAESPDGIFWKRKDHLAGIDVSKSGFDSKMIEYAAITEHNGRHYMFYNGNEFGQYGIGLAVEE